MKEITIKEKSLRSFLKNVMLEYPKERDNMSGIPVDNDIPTHLLKQEIYIKKDLYSPDQNIIITVQDQTSLGKQLLNTVYNYLIQGYDDVSNVMVLIDKRPSL